MGGDGAPVGGSNSLVVASGIVELVVVGLIPGGEGVQADPSFRGGQLGQGSFRFSDGQVQR